MLDGSSCQEQGRLPPVADKIVYQLEIDNATVTTQTMDMFASVGGCCRLHSAVVVCVGISNRKTTIDLPTPVILI